MAKVLALSALALSMLVVQLTASAAADPAPQVAVTVLASPSVGAEAWVTRATAGNEATPVRLSPGVLAWTEPNGKTAWALRAGALEEIDLASGGVTRLPEPVYDGQAAPIEQFAVGAETVAFVAQNGSGNVLGYVRAPARIVHWLPAPVPGRWSDQVSVSADGSTIAGVEFGGDTDLPPSVATYDVKTNSFGPGSSIAQPPPDVAYPMPVAPSGVPAAVYPSDAPWLALSPNGESVAFLSAATGSHYQVEVEDLVTGAISKLVTDIAVQGIRWSPDGKAIAIWDGQGSSAGDFSVRLFSPTGHLVLTEPGGKEAYFVESAPGEMFLVYTALMATTLGGKSAVDAVPESGGHPIVLAAGPYDCVGCGEFSSVAVPTSTSKPHLFVSTPAIPPPGWLYAWPKFPTLVPLDDNTWISVHSWVIRPRSATARGSMYTDDHCTNRPASSCPPKVVASVELTASSPKTCTVRYEVQATGALQAARELVYDDVGYVVSSTHRSVSLESPCR
jgi:hypothetical protein